MDSHAVCRKETLFLDSHYNYGSKIPLPTDLQVDSHIFHEAICEFTLWIHFDAQNTVVLITSWWATIQIDEAPLNETVQFSV